MTHKNVKLHHTVNPTANGGESITFTHNISHEGVATQIIMRSYCNESQMLVFGLTPEFLRKMADDIEQSKNMCTDTLFKGE